MKKDLFLILVVGKIGVVNSVGEKSLFGVDDTAIFTDADEKVNFFTGFDAIGIPTEAIG